MDATFWEWDPLAVGIMAPLSLSLSYLTGPVIGEALEEARRYWWLQLPVSLHPCCPPYYKGGWMPPYPAPSLKLPSDNILSSFGSLLGAGVC